MIINTKEIGENTVVEEVDIQTEEDALQNEERKLNELISLGAITLDEEGRILLVPEEYSGWRTCPIREEDTPIHATREEYINLVIGKMRIDLETNSIVKHIVKKPVIKKQ